MTDRRFHAANDNVAHRSLEGRIDAHRFADGQSRRIIRPVADLCAAPRGGRDKQLLYGQAFVALDSADGWVFGVDPVDGYVGYLSAEALGHGPEPTHIVTARSTHAYADPDFKSPEQTWLSAFSKVAVSQVKDHFAKTDLGWIPAQHLEPLDWRANEFVAEAEKFLGAPYLWGGNAASGLDCSGLVQLACHAVGRTCPRDSDLQEAHFQDVTDDPHILRGDLFFWKGHVAIALDDATLIHANAHHMAVASEPINSSIARIEAQGGGPVTSRRRP